MTVSISQPVPKSTQNTTTELIHEEGSGATTEEISFNSTWRVKDDSHQEIKQAGGGQVEALSSHEEWRRNTAGHTHTLLPCCA